MTARDFSKAIKKIQREFEQYAEAEVRRRWREEEKLVYVKEYTVKAHFYPYKKRKKHLRLVA